MSAHFINILLISVRFSGVVRAVVEEVFESGVPRPLCCKNKLIIKNSYTVISGDLSAFVIYSEKEI